MAHKHNKTQGVGGCVTHRSRGRFTIKSPQNIRLAGPVSKPKKRKKKRQRPCPACGEHGCRTFDLPNTVAVSYF